MQRGPDAARAVAHRPSEFLRHSTNRFEIFKKHRSRYAPGGTHNLEHVFSLSVPEPLPVTLDPAEHLSYEWLPWREAAARTISWSNRDAILAVPQRLGVSAR